MKLHRNESGQMLIMTAVELTLLIGFLALAADVGVLFHSKRHMQTAADAAATAAALNQYNGGVNATGYSDATIADNAAAANGYTNGSSGTVVTVNTPPANGYHQSTGYVEVIISRPDPLYFFRVLTGNTTATVAARAVAGAPVGATGCIYLTAESGTGLYLQGSAYINAPDCGIYVNSTSSNAVYMNNACGTGGCVNAAFLDTPGGLGKKQTYPTNTSVVSAGSTPPYQNLPYPNPADICSPGTVNQVVGNTYGFANYVQTSAGQPVLPSASYTFTTTDGSSTASIPVTCFYQKVTIGANSQSVTTLPGGYYVFENGVTMNGTITWGAYSKDPSATVGATLYNYSGLMQQSNGYMSIYSPNLGPFNGVAIEQPATNSNTLNLQFGMSGANSTDCSNYNAALDGYIVAPSAQVYLQDSGGGVLVTGIVASTLYVKASTLTVCNYNLVNNSTTPLRDIALVE